MIISRLYDYIGSTPILKLEDNFYCKLEYFNPSGSIKDRATFRMVKDIKKRYIIEATSGNTGISLSMFSKSLGYNAIIVMPITASIERAKMMKRYGAKIVFVSNMKDAVLVANILEKRIDDSIFLDQFNNINNVLAHYETTGVEILNDVSDIDYLICGIGTGGTITGVGKYLKEHSNCKVIGVLPFDIPHKIEGIGAGFKPSILDEEIIDEVVTITDDEAFIGYKKLNYLGIPVGISSGACYMAGLRYHNKYLNKKIVMIFPDSVNRYLSVLED